MKKIILLFGIILLSCNLVYSKECQYTCVSPYDMNNKFSTVISKITGLNFVRTQITEKVLKKTISKSIQSSQDLKVDIDSYSAGDLARGIFRSMSISGSDVNIDGIYLSSFELKSLCEFNYIKYDNKGNLTFKEDFPISFSFVMSASDINNTMKSEKYQKVINDLDRLSFLGVKILSTEASIRGNKFYYVVRISVPFMKEQKVEITADVNVKDGKIDFNNTRLASNSFKFDLKKIDFLMNYLNPLDFSVNIFDNKDAKVYIKNIAIKNNEVFTDGIVIIPKD